jgi:hypothetical protein
LKFSSSGQVSCFVGSPVAWFAAVLVFRAVLDAIFFQWVSVYAWGDGFVFNLNTVRVLESLVALILTAYLTPRRVERLADFFLLSIFILCVVPITSYYSNNQVVADGLFSRIIFWNLIFQYVLLRGTLWLLSNYGPRGFPRPPYSVAVAYVLLGVIVISCMFHLASTQAADRFVLGFENMYTRRAEVTALLDGGIWGYALSWLQKICAIYLLVVGVYRRKIWMSVLALTILLFLFGVLAQKSILFAAVVALGILATWRLVEVGSAIALALIALLLVVLAVGYFAFGTTDLYLSIFTRRLFFVPARLDFVYFHFFADKAPLYFSNGFMRSLLIYPFEKNYTLLIGEFARMGGEGTAANNGFLATGYMQLGWAGTVIYPVIVAVLCWLAEVLSKGNSLKHVAAVCFYPFAALFTSADLPTSILTHGIGLLLCLLWLDTWGLRAHGSSDDLSIE